MESIDLNAEGTLHERDDCGSELNFSFSERGKGPIRDLVRVVAAMPAAERARLVLDVPGGRTLNVAEILALAASEGLA